MQKAFYDKAEYEDAVTGKIKCRYDVFDPVFDNMLDKKKAQPARSAAGKTPFIVGKMAVGKFRVGVVNPKFDELLQAKKR